MEFKIFRVGPSVLSLHRLVLFTILMNVVTLAAAQRIHISAGVEKTAVRFLYGGSTTFELKSKVGVGVFAQSGFPARSHEINKAKDIFYGAVFQLPLAKTEKIDVFATARLGFVNDHYFVAVPGVETRVRTIGNLSTVFSMGYRSGYPSIGLRLSHPIL